LAAFSVCSFVSFGIKPSVAAPAAAEAIRSICCEKNQNNKKQTSFSHWKNEWLHDI